MVAQPDNKPENTPIPATEQDRYNALIAKIMREVPEDLVGTVLGFADKEGRLPRDLLHAMRAALNIPDADQRREAIEDAIHIENARQQGLDVQDLDTAGGATGKIKTIDFGDVASGMAAAAEGVFGAMETPPPQLPERVSPSGDREIDDMLGSIFGGDEPLPPQPAPQVPAKPAEIVEERKFDLTQYYKVPLNLRGAAQILLKEIEREKLVPNAAEVASQSLDALLRNLESQTTVDTRKLTEDLAQAGADNAAENSRKDDRNAIYSVLKSLANSEYVSPRGLRILMNPPEPRFSMKPDDKEFGFDMRISEFAVAHEDKLKDLRERSAEAMMGFVFHQAVPNVRSTRTNSADLLKGDRPELRVEMELPDSVKNNEAAIQRIAQLTDSTPEEVANGRITISDRQQNLLSQNINGNVKRFAGTGAGSGSPG